MTSLNFTETEVAVLRLLMKGLTTREVAAQRKISLNQVEEHIRNLRKKTGARTLFELGYGVGLERGQNG